MADAGELKGLFWLHRWYSDQFGFCRMLDGS